MKFRERESFLLMTLCVLFSGCLADAVMYNYSYTYECLEHPLEPQYGGGIVVNPRLDMGLKGWYSYGNGTIRTSFHEKGNMFLESFHRLSPDDSFSQYFHLDKDKYYTFSAWFQVKTGSAEIIPIFNTTTSYEIPGRVVAKSGCWSMLKGGFVPTSTGPAQLYFESKNTKVDMWIDNVSLQPFSPLEWKAHQDRSVDKFRKSNVKIHVIDDEGRPVANASVSIRQLNPSFPFGCAMNWRILANPAYQKWFTSRFRVTTFENELKWYFTEPIRGKPDYSIPDKMIQFAQDNRISVRGHNVFWDDPKYQPWWVNRVSTPDFRDAVDGRVESVVRRYVGKLIHWDVINENLHFSYLESKLGANASGVMFEKVRQIDDKAILFMNEYNTSENLRDRAACPDKYLDKIREIRAGGYNGPLGIGLEGHFDQVNLPYMRATLDMLASAGAPIWFTELDVVSGPNQEARLEELLREAHAYPSVYGIVMWASWKPEGCFRMCLTDNNFTNLGVGDVVDKKIFEWSHHGLTGTTDARGHLQMSLFHGDYNATITTTKDDREPCVHRFRVTPHVESEDNVYVVVPLST